MNFCSWLNVRSDECVFNVGQSCEWAWWWWWCNYHNNTLTHFLHSELSSRVSKREKWLVPSWWLGTTTSCVQHSCSFQLFFIINYSAEFDNQNVWTVSQSSVALQGSLSLIMEDKERPIWEAETTECWIFCLKTDWNN